MRRGMRRRWLGVMLLLVACGDDIPDVTNQATLGSDGTAAGTTAADTGPETAADDSTGDETPEVVLSEQLTLELLTTADVEIVRTGETLTATLTLRRGYGVAPDEQALTGPARIDAYPEVGATLYTARLSSEPVAGGRCGAQPVSLALSLHTREGSDIIGGGVTAYCGADTWYGVPVIEPLRLWASP